MSWLAESIHHHLGVVPVVFLFFRSPFFGWLPGRTRRKTTFFLLGGTEDPFPQNKQTHLMDIFEGKAKPG